MMMNSERRCPTCSAWASQGQNVALSSLYHYECSNGHVFYAEDPEDEAEAKATEAYEDEKALRRARELGWGPRSS